MTIMNNEKLNSSDDVISDVVMDESVIETYLRAHPDFFQRHSSLIESLEIPHGKGKGTASLIERQVSVLRDKSRDLEEQLTGLIRTARGNEQIVTRLQHFTLALMRTNKLDDVIAKTQDILQEDFNTDFVTLKIIGNDDAAQFFSEKSKILKSFHKLFLNKVPSCNRLQEQQQLFLFDEKVEVINSIAVIPLFNKNEIGLLALASKDEARFHPGMGTVFLSHLGELVSASLSRYL